MENVILETLLRLFVSCFIAVAVAETPSLFLSDRLSPYEEGKHGSGRSRRDVTECQHVRWSNRTYEEYHVDLVVPESAMLEYELFRFADTVRSELENPLSIHRTRYLLGSIAFVDNPFLTMSVLEPYEPGGCKVNYFSASRSTVSATSSRRAYGCKLALNAGYFSVISGQCLGNIVSDGRVVQSTSEQNANFGIRQDGTIVVGYISEEEIISGSYRQLVSGVLWLVRNGTNYVNESMGLECASHQDTGKMSTFVEVLSARTAIGHDSQGRIVVAYVEGQTHRRGSNLYDFADLLVSHGVVNAINLDGGGSTTFLHNQVLVNYPSDHCPRNSAYRCEREVSTVLCFHDVQCLEPSCSNHGTCHQGECTCESPWFGNSCALLNCSLTECSDHGNCTDGICMCESGWEGETCDKVCSSGFYGPGCTSRCWCYGRSKCDPVTGACKCPPGYTGFGCWKECDDGFYGQDCQLRCPYHNCTDNGQCSAIDGTCQCSSNWTGVACNESLKWNLVQSASLTQMEAIGTTKTSDHMTTITTSEIVETSAATRISEDGTDIGAQSLKLFSSSVALSSGISCYPPQVQPTVHNCRNCGLVILILCMVAAASVIVHIFICVRLNVQKQYVPKRRKLRKRNQSQFRPLDSSSDCTI